MLASSGEITEPCPVPTSLVVTTPSSRMPARSHFWIRRMMRLSPIRCSRKRTNHDWLTLPKERRQTAHRRDFPDSVTITRERHPFEGRALPVIGSIRRNGVLFALACLPDGSRALVPAQWTDWDEGRSGGRRAYPDDRTGLRVLGSLGDLLRLRHLLDALRRRPVGSAPQQEGHGAIETGGSRPARPTAGTSGGAACADTLGTDRSGGTARGPRPPRAPDRRHARGRRERSRR